ncbi:MAG TPA: hypothetical protein DIC57_08820 [Sphaerochaeta sp.]|nr:hypothetical protein [Sphaerochaeta sp.]
MVVLFQLAAGRQRFCFRDRAIAFNVVGEEGRHGTGDIECFLLCLGKQQRLVSVVQEADWHGNAKSYGKQEHQKEIALPRLRLHFAPSSNGCRFSKNDKNSAFTLSILIP